METSASQASERRLEPHQRERVLDALLRCRVAGPEVCRRAVEEARLVLRQPRWSEVRGPISLVAHVALASRADGIALGRRCFVRRTDPDGRVPLRLIAHEVTHVAQILREGTATFYARYAASYLAARARGWGDERAYLSIPYEVEARAVAALIPG